MASQVPEACELVSATRNPPIVQVESISGYLDCLLESEELKFHLELALQTGSQDLRMWFWGSFKIQIITLPFLEEPTKLYLPIAVTVKQASLLGLVSWNMSDPESQWSPVLRGLGILFVKGGEDF